MVDKAELQARYGASEHGNFRIVDTIAVPHPYTITPKHLEHCDSMVLNADTIAHAEKKGVKCGWKRCTLSFAEHEQALVVECALPLHDDNNNTNPELQAYLLKCKDMATADKYAGFAFVKPDGTGAK